MSGPTGGNGRRPDAPARPPAIRPGAPAGATPAMAGRPGPGGPRGPGAMGMGMGLPPARSKDFRGSSRRLFGRLRPERTRIAVVAVLAIVSVAFAVLGPRILGNATNLIFEGALSRQFPAGVTQEQVIATLRTQGQDQLATMLSTLHLVPGSGIDFGALGGVLALLVTVYGVSSLFAWIQAYIMASVTQRTVLRLREDVDRKLGRLPLRYFDEHPRGDVLSRVTNDIDNIGQSLQQTLTQLITALLTIVGVLLMMFLIDPILAAVSLLAVPASLGVTLLIVRRSQQQFVAQWASTGALNGHVEEMHTGHAIVKAFGRQRQAIETFETENERLFQASSKAQFISGIIQPAIAVISNLNYVVIAVVGGFAWRRGRCRSAMWWRSSSTRVSSRSRSSRRRAWSTCCSPRSPRPSGCSSCWTSRKRPRKHQRRRRSSGPAAP